jgi:calcineurin-like phosphoesterase family protein
MNEHIIACWNEVVSENDFVVHGGDFAFGKKTDAVEILKRLNGKIHIVRGNHDRNLKPLIEMGFYGASNYWYRDGIYVIHDPEKRNPIIFDECKIMLYGHVHSATISLPKSKNISVEVLNYFPIEI